MDRRTDSDQQSKSRSRLASFLLVLLPGFMFLGFLAPAAVTVQYEGEEEAALPLAFRNFQLPVRRPMVGESKRIVATGGAELAAIRDAVTSGARMLADGAKSLFAARADFEAQDGGDRILLDEKAAEEEVVSRLFESTKDSDTILTVDLDPLWKGSRFDIIPSPLRTWGERLDDDFAGEEIAFTQPVPAPVPIPEPGTAALVALGLVGLTVARRR